MVTEWKAVPIEGDQPFDLGPEYEAAIEADRQRKARAKPEPAPDPARLPDW
jgi:hypothetical protein